MVVPFAAGGPVDVLGRILAQYLSRGARQAGHHRQRARRRRHESARCGCRRRHPTAISSCSASIGTHALNQTLSKKPLYNAATDFAPVALIADVGLVLLDAQGPAGATTCRSSSPTPRPTRPRCSSPRAAPAPRRISAACCSTRPSASRSSHVPYRGGGPALADLIAGRVDYLCNIASTVGQALETKQVNALAALTRERSPILPDLPTAHEQGLTDFDAYTWNAVFLPKGTPPALVDKLNARDRQGDGQSGIPRAPAHARPDRGGAGAAHARVSAEHSSRARSTNGRRRSRPAA